MLEVAWFAKEANDANIMAVLKRAHLFVNAQTFLYVRPAGEEKKPVIRIPLGNKCDFLHEDSRHIYDYYRKGGTDLPADFEEKLQWEASWMSAAMAGKVRDLPRRVTILCGARLFDVPFTPPPFVPDETPPSERLERKRTFASLQASTNTVIEITGSPCRSSPASASRPLIAVKKEPEEPEGSVEAELERLMDEEAAEHMGLDEDE